MKKRDLTGMRSGHIVAISYNTKTDNGGCKWNVRCDCGEEFVVWAEQVTRQRTKQCRKCRNKLISVMRSTHGQRKSTTYSTWSQMIDRCTNPKSGNWDNYGGRGITICNQWKDSFENFLKDMGERPEGKTIDRKNNDGNYEPENCHWASATEQGNNRRTNKTITFNGKSQTFSEWGRELGIDKTLIRQRVLSGWPVEKVLSQERFFAGVANLK